MRFSGMILPMLLLTSCFGTAPARKPEPSKKESNDSSIDLDQIQLATSLCKTNKGIKRIMNSGPKTRITCGNGARFQEDKPPKRLSKEDK